MFILWNTNDQVQAHQSSSSPNPNIQVVLHIIYDPPPNTSLPTTCTQPWTDPCTDPCTAQLARWPRPQSDPTQQVPSWTTWYCYSIVIFFEVDLCRILLHRKHITDKAAKSFFLNIGNAKFKHFVRCLLPTIKVTLFCNIRGHSLIE